MTYSTRNRKSSGKNSDSKPTRVCIGFDTEFDTSPENPLQIPVSLQLFVEGYTLTDKQISEVYKQAKRKGLELLRVTNESARAGYGVGLFFDCRGLEAGSENYLMYFSDCLTLILKYVVRIKDSLKYELELFTFYSNAEIACMCPRKEDWQKLMKLQGDTEKRNPNNLKIYTVQGTFVVKNFRYRLPDKCVATIRDAGHLFYKGSLKALGKLVGIPKLEHPDWDKVSAGQWLEFDPEGMIDYGIKDAMIPVLAALDFHKNRDQFIRKLDEKEIVDKDGATVKRLLESVSMTASSVSDKGVKAYWQNRSWWKLYDESTKDLLENHLPPAAQRTKGGLNKFFMGDKPMLFKEQDIYDVVAMYAFAQKHLKLPVKQPTYLNCNHEEFMPITEFATMLDEYDQAKIHLDWILPDNANEWERTIVAYDSDGEGCTLQKAEKQWIGLLELQNQATITPDAIIRVRCCMVWKLEKLGEDYIELREFIEYGIELRDEYKSLWKASGETDIDAKLLSDTIKLICNGTAGKLGQCKNGLAPDELHETLIKGGLVSATANGAVQTASITNPLHFNNITEMARVFTAYAAYINKAKMVVTDSMVVDSGTYKDPKDYLTPYKQLNKVLQIFRFELEHSNKTALIYKERDYILFDIKPEKEGLLLESLETGEFCLDNWSDINITKVAKRGWKAPPVTQEEWEGVREQIFSNDPNWKLPKGMSWDKEDGWEDYYRNCTFFLQSLPRMQGMPIRYEKTTLLKAKEQLLGKGILNSRTISLSQIGSENNRYLCTDVLEWRRRKLIKQGCKAKGYADGLHCKLENPELYDQITRRCIPKPHHVESVPPHLKKLIGILAASGKRQYSLRKLEALTGIGKSSIQRWGKELKDSKLDLGDISELQIHWELIQQWFEKKCPTFLIGDSPQVASGTVTSTSFETLLESSLEHAEIF